MKAGDRWHQLSSNRRPHSGTGRCRFRPSRYHRLYAIERRILRDGYAAEGAVQDALLKSWPDVRGLRDPAAFDAWLHRLLINACHAVLRCNVDETA
jgi:Sigma-70 region 2